LRAGQQRARQFHPDLDTTRADLIIRKGFRREIDSYSAFFENDQTTPTGLEGYLRTRGITKLTLVGLATDFCVNFSAVDAARLGSRSRCAAIWRAPSTSTDRSPRRGQEWRMRARYCFNSPGALLFAVLFASAPIAGRAETTCAIAPGYGTDDTALAALLDRALPVIDRFASLRDALGRNRARDLPLHRPDRGAGVFRNRGRRRISIDADLDPDLQLAVLLHEMRHVEHFTRGLCPDLSLSMQDYARAVWAMEADAAVVSMIVTWDMARHGDPGPFQALANHPQTADIADVFATTMGLTQDVAESSAAAFSAWYESDSRRMSYYVASCSAYLDQQERSHALPQYGQLDEGFFPALCRLPNGGRLRLHRPFGGLGPSTPSSFRKIRTPEASPRPRAPEGGLRLRRPPPRRTSGP
jgi:hypothetical protein